MSSVCFVLCFNVHLISSVGNVFEQSDRTFLFFFVSCHSFIVSCFSFWNPPHWFWPLLASPSRKLFLNFDLSNKALNYIAALPPLFTFGVLFLVLPCLRNTDLLSKRMELILGWIPGKYLYRGTTDSMASDHTDTLETSMPRTTYPSKFHSTRLLGRPRVQQTGKVGRRERDAHSEGRWDT